MSRRTRIVRRMHRWYARLTHPDAHRVDAMAATGSLDEMGGKYCLVVSFRRDGTPVPTPVWFGVGDGRLYFRAEAGSGKLKRIRANPAVRIARCDARGRPSGAPFDATARIVDPSGEPRAEQVIQQNYGRVRRWYERWLTLPEGAYVEVTPTGTT